MKQRFMLDTNAVRMLLERRSPQLDQWFAEERCSLSAIVAAEIRFGLARRRLPERRAAPNVPVRVRGFDISEQVALFSEPQLPEALLAEQMHAHMGAWIRDSALAVLDHRNLAHGGNGQRTRWSTRESRG